MTFATLIRANLKRNPVRTLLTGLCLVIAFLLFGLLQPINHIFSNGPELSDAGRLVVLPKHSTSDLLPVHYVEKIQSQKDVVNVGHMTWFGGTYVDPVNFFPQFAVGKDTFLEIMQEIELPKAQRDAFLTTRRGAIVGKTTADKYGWALGDSIPLIPNIWHNREGVAWTFELVGIFRSTGKGLVNDEGFYFGFAYFDDYRAFGNGQVTSLLAVGKTPATIAQTAKSIDLLFENSSDETKTMSDREYALSFARQMGDVGLIVSAILGAVLFTMLMLTANTINQATRERMGELAVMKVLGFSSGAVLCMVLIEALLLVFIAAALGMLLAQLLLFNLPTLIPDLNQLGPILIGPTVLLQSALVALGIGLLVGIPPAIKAMRLSIVDALRV